MKHVGTMLDPIAQTLEVAPKWNETEVKHLVEKISTEVAAHGKNRTTTISCTT